MNILFINHLPMNTASFYRQLGAAKILKEKGHNIKILLRSKSFMQGANKFNNINGIDLFYWHEPFEHLFLFNSLQVIKHAKNADVIYLNRANPFSATSTFIANFFCKKPIVVDLEDWDAIGGYASMAKKKMIEKFAMTFFEEVVPRKSDCVVVVSKYLYNRVIAMGVPKDCVFYAPNCADTDFFNPDISRRDMKIRYGLGDNVIVAMGILYDFELSIWKKLMEIISIVVKKIPDAKLLLIGGGEGLEKIKKLVKSYSLQENVIFTGYVNREDVPRCIAAGDVAIHLLDDGFFYCHNQSPVTIAEFIAMGKPIVATDVGEVGRAVKGVGILIKGLNPEKYAKAIIKMLENPELRERYGGDARSRAIERYSMEILAEKAEKACERALAVRGGKR